LLQQWFSLSDPPIEDALMKFALWASSVVSILIVLLFNGLRCFILSSACGDGVKGSGSCGFEGLYL
jgi:hypothetical protein